MSYRRYSRRVVAAAAGAALVALLLAVPLQAAPPQQDVTVVNTTAQPVPVAVQGTPSVAIQGTPSVTGGNTNAQAIPTRHADEPALQPVQRTALVIIGAGDQIEEASVRAQLFAGVTEAMVFLRSDGGGFGGHYVPLTSLGTLDGFGKVLVGTELLNGYADAGTPVDTNVTINTATGSGGRFEVTLAGHLVDL